eukprot:COSAG02_NODE_33447_length_500_cov_0.576060_1_plen_120_part_10
MDAERLALQDVCLPAQRRSDARIVLQDQARGRAPVSQSHACGCEGSCCDCCGCGRDGELGLGCLTTVGRHHGDPARGAHRRLRLISVSQAVRARPMTALQSPPLWIQPARDGCERRYSQL